MRSSEALSRRLLKLERANRWRDRSRSPFVVRLPWARREQLPEHLEPWSAPGTGIDAEAARAIRQAHPHAVLAIPEPLSVEEWNIRARIHQRHMLSFASHVGRVTRRAVDDE
jgi:hypothetical protein